MQRRETKYRRELVRQHIQRLRDFRAVGLVDAAMREGGLIDFLWQQYRALTSGRK